MKKAELADLLQDDPKSLFWLANEVRRAVCGNGVQIRGVLEFSNYCIQRCNYCYQCANREDVVRYRLSAEQIINLAVSAHNAGFKTIILQSGEDPSFPVDALTRAIREIRDRTELAIMLHIGETPLDNAKRLFDAGAARYLIQHVTANPRLFSEIARGKSLSDRIQFITEMKQIGFQIAGGSVVGLPGQTWDDIAADILLCRELGAEMAYFSPYLPDSEEIAGGNTTGTFMKADRTQAATRIVLRSIHLPSTFTRPLISSGRQFLGLLRGANVLIRPITPVQYKEDNPLSMWTDPGRWKIEKPGDLEPSLAAIGRHVATDAGDPLPYRTPLSECRPSQEDSVFS